MIYSISHKFIHHYLDPFFLAIFWTILRLSKRFRLLYIVIIFCRSSLKAKQLLAIIFRREEEKSFCFVFGSTVEHQPDFMAVEVILATSPAIECEAFAYRRLWCLSTYKVERNSVFWSPRRSSTSSRPKAMYFE